MLDTNKTKEQLIDELAELRQRISELEKSEVERKRAEAALKHSEERYRELVEKADIAILIDNKEGNIQYFNKKLAKLFGYSMKEMKNQSIGSIVHPDDLNRVMRFHKNRIQSKKAQSRYEFRGIKKDGSPLYLEINAVKLKDKNNIIGTRSYMWDITERKKAEEELENIFNLSPDMVAVCTTEGKFLKVNPSWEKVLGYTQKELLDLGWAKLVHPDDVEKTNKEVEKQLKGSSVVNFVNRYKCKDGSYKTFEWQATFAKEGIIHATARDITERKKAEEEIKNSRAQLRDLAAHLQAVREQERTLIAREMHDELGQSLTALKMDLALLSPKLPREQKSLLEKTKSMTKLVDKTLQTVKRISTELRPGLLDDLGLPAAIEWQGEEFQNRTGIKCEITIAPEDIILDPDRSTAIFRIFQETLTNVTRHARATRIKVTLRKKARKIELRVKDNGKGITEKQITDSRSFGLIGIRERAQFFGGAAEIKGIPDKGTTLTATIPLSGEGEAQ